MKLWGSVKQQANKLAFETEKALRVKRQEGVISGIRDKVEALYTEMGKAAYSLMDEGAIAHPQLASFANQVASLQEQITAEAQKLVAMQAEEFDLEAPASEEAPAAPAPAAYVAPPEPAASSVPPPEPAASSEPEEPEAPPPPPAE